MRSESRLFVLPFSPLHRGLGLRSLVGSYRTFKPFYSCPSTQSSLVYMRAENENRTRSVFLGPVARLASSPPSSSLLHLTGVGAVVQCCIERLGWSGGPKAVFSKKRRRVAQKGSERGEPRRSAHQRGFTTEDVLARPISVGSVYEKVTFVAAGRSREEKEEGGRAE